MELLALDRAPAPRAPCGFGGGLLEEQREGIIVRCEWRDSSAVPDGGRDGEGAASSVEKCGQDGAVLAGKHHHRFTGGVLALVATARRGRRGTPKEVNRRRLPLVPGRKGYGPVWAEFLGPSWPHGYSQGTAGPEKVH